MLTVKALDPPELAAFYPTARRRKEAVKVLKRSAPLQPHLDILTIETVLWDRHSLHQSACVDPPISASDFSGKMQRYS